MSEKLNEKELDWVVETMGGILGNKHKLIKCPSEKAWNRLQKNLTEAKIQKKDIPYSQKL